MLSARAPASKTPWGWKTWRSPRWESAAVDLRSWMFLAGCRSRRATARAAGVGNELEAMDADPIGAAVHLDGEVWSRP